MTEDDLVKLRAWGRGLTKSVHDADDLIQSAIEAILRKGDEPTRFSVWGYMKNLWMREKTRRAREISHEPRIIEYIAEEEYERLYGGEVLMVPHSRHRGQQALAGTVGFGKGHRMPLWDCQVCGRKYKPKLRHGKRVRSCGRAECAAEMRRRPRKEDELCLSNSCSRG